MNASHWFAANNISAQAATPAPGLTKVDFEKIQEAGFDHVRITVDPELLRKYPNKWDDLDVALKDIFSDHLNVVLVLYPSDDYKCHLTAYYNPQYTNCARAENAQGQADEIAKQRADFTRFWVEFAQRYARQSPDPSKLYFEILNEPEVTDEGLKDWSAFEGTLIQAIYQAAPCHTIIGTGGGYSGLEDLLKFDPPPSFGATVIYTFHFYLPYAFAQGWDDPKGRYPYPSAEPPLPGKEPLTLDEKYKLNEYALDRWDQDRIQSEIAFAQTWSDVHHLPVWCGEFGVTKSNHDGNYDGNPDRNRDRNRDGNQTSDVNSRSRMRADWLQQVRTALEQNHIGWAVWDWNTQDYGIVAGENPGPPVLPLSVRNALFSPAPPNLNPPNLNR